MRSVGSTLHSWMSHTRGIAEAPPTVAGVDVRTLLAQIPNLLHVMEIVKASFSEQADREELDALVKHVSDSCLYLTEAELAFIKPRVIELENALEGHGVLSRDNLLFAKREELLRSLRFVADNKSLRSGMPPHLHKVKELKANELELTAEVCSRGGYKVMRGKLNSELENVLVKQYNSIQDARDLEVLKQSLRNHAALQIECSHGNILNLIGFCVLEPQQPCLVFSECKLGDLQSILFLERHIQDMRREVHEALTQREATLCHVLLGVASALRHMHERRPPIAHLNVRSSSVQLEALHQGWTNWTDRKLWLCPRLTDFDLAEEVSIRPSVYTSLPVSDPSMLPYVAPERLQQDAAGRLGGSTHADEWAFGMLLFETVCQTPPYKDYTDQNEDVSKPISICQLPSFDDHRSKDCYNKLYEDLALKCWRATPSQRISMDNLAFELKIRLRDLDDSAPPADIEGTDDGWDVVG